MSPDDSKSSAGKVAIIVAIIGLFGTLLTVVINNWDKIFAAKTITTDTVKNTSTIHNMTFGDTAYVKPSGPNQDSAVSKIPEPDYINIARQICKLFWTNHTNNNVEGLIFSSTIPFDADKKKIITNYDDLRQFYSDSKDKSTLSISTIEINKASELKEKGLLTSKSDTLFGELHLEQDPYIGIISYQTENNSLEAIMIIFKKVDNTLKIAGIED